MTRRTFNFPLGLHPLSVQGVRARWSGECSCSFVDARQCDGLLCLQSDPGKQQLPLVRFPLSTSDRHRTMRARPARNSCQRGYCSRTSSMGLAAIPTSRRMAKLASFWRSDRSRTKRSYRRRLRQPGRSAPADFGKRTWRQRGSRCVVAIGRPTTLLISKIISTCRTEPISTYTLTPLQSGFYHLHLTANQRRWNGHGHRF